MTSSSARRYQCRSVRKRRRSSTGYATSCPGPWYVTCRARTQQPWGQGHQSRKEAETPKTKCKRGSYVSVISPSA